MELDNSNTDSGLISDGYHTFNELYEHRHLLFIALAKAYPELGWRSLKHEDGTSLEGWFIAGMKLCTGNISYHLPLRFWDYLSGIETLELGYPWDGHTSKDVLDRLRSWVTNP